MSHLVRQIRPERWKVFQVLPMAGQNDGRVEDLLIDRRQFAAFVHRHQHLAVQGLAPIVEDNSGMRGSYVMVDPLGRCFGNATGRHVYSDPILEAGVQKALARVGYIPAKLEVRGGMYAWRGTWVVMLEGARYVGSLSVRRRKRASCRGEIAAPFVCQLFAVSGSV
jgi:radical S-adenosyl methionine domain-containing protein 2